MPAGLAGGVGLVVSLPMDLVDHAMAERLGGQRQLFFVARCRLVLRTVEGMGLEPGAPVVG